MIKITADGSTTVYTSRFNQYYHSIFGATEESELVFIELGLKHALGKFGEIKLLEMGFGTGLNALLSANFALDNKREVEYTGLEAYPIDTEMVSSLSFDVRLFHEKGWDERYQINNYFGFRKYKVRVEDFQTTEKYNLVYFDAFAPESQPELWTTAIFEKLAGLMESGGILTTYCSKSYVQRNLKAAGFHVEKHSGPFRKREVLRAILL